MTFGERLKEARLAKGWTHTKLAEVSGVHENNISTYERGIYEPRIFTAVCLADALGVSLDWLAGRSEKGGVSR
jgi:transcriptional regulator with XRE-family HTH domain